MPITNPYVSTNIETPQVNNPDRTNLESFLGGLRGGQAGASQAMEAQNAVKLEQLRALLQGQSQDATINKARDLQSNLESSKPGHKYSAAVGANSATISESDQDLSGKMAMDAKKGEEKAIQGANSAYNKGASKIVQTAQASKEGLDLVNDPKQTGSLGQARTLALKMFGMNRYNENEAKAVVPPALQGTFSGIMNFAGDDATPLNEAQKRSLNSLFQGGLQNAKDQHDLLRKNAMGVYNSSLYSNPNRSQALEQNIGAPVDKDLSDSMKKYASLPNTQTAPAERPQPTGLVDRLRNMISPPSAVAASPASPAPAAAPTGPPPGLSFEQFQAWKAQNAK